MCWGGSTRSLATGHAIGTVNLTTPTKTWVSSVPCFRKLFPHPRIEGELSGYRYGTSAIMGDGKRLAPAKMDGRLGTYGPYPGNLLGTGGLVAGVVAPGQHLFEHFLAVFFSKIDPTSALSTLDVNIIERGLPERRIPYPVMVLKVRAAPHGAAKP